MVWKKLSRTVHSYSDLFFQIPSRWSVHFLQKLLKSLGPSPTKANLVQKVALFIFTFLGTVQFFLKKEPNHFSKLIFFVPSRFPSLIEHERHPLGVWELFSDLFINTSWACFKNFAHLSLRNSADFRRFRLLFFESFEKRFARESNFV